MNNFQKWNEAFRQQNLFVFNNDENGILWLKTRAVCRSKQLKQFIEKAGISLTSTKLAAQFEELFLLLERSPENAIKLDSFLRDQNNEWYRLKNVDEEKLKSDLRKIDTYEWGGDQENSLDQYIIRRYVKVICDLEELERASEEIKQNTWNFVRTSWYNNWTSYIIESYFKRNSRVLSAIGEIKSVDFFIDNYPIDLKVTYFPDAFMADKVKEILGKHELTWIKQQAKEKGILPDKNLSDKDQKKYLLEELENHRASEAIKTLNDARSKVIQDAIENPIELITWLYENQSARLFGAENRLFVVLIDSTDLTQSWKMKRAFSIMEPQINTYLKDFSPSSLKDINFSFGGKAYRSLSDIIFITK